MKYGYNLFSAWETVQDRQSLISMMKSLRELGYDGVEFFLYFDIPAAEMRDLTGEIGLTPFSTHPRMARFFDHLDEEIDYAKTAGIETLVMPHVPDEDRSPAYYKRLLDAIPRWKRACDSAGLRLAWHNHEFEFEPWEDRRWLLDAILEAAPVDYEPDIFWTTFTQVDTLALMERYKDRIRYVHFKDYKGARGKSFADIDFCAVGEGLVDVKAAAQKAREIGAKWAVVEQDLHRRDVLEDAKISLQTLKKLFDG